MLLTKVQIHYLHLSYLQWLKKLLKCLLVFERLHCYGMMM